MLAARAAARPLLARRTVACLSTAAAYKKPARPTSPHVTIYKFPTNALMSISHRATGVGLFVGASGVAALALAGDCNIPAYVESFKEAAPMLVPLAKLAVGFPIVYHYVSGVRHLYWDFTASGLERDEIDMSAKVALGVVGAVTASLVFVSI